MGARGPKQKPIALIKEKGYFRDTRHKDDMVDSNVLDFVYNGFPDPPDDYPTKAKQLWVMQLSQAMRLWGYISFIDLTLFGEYCYCFSELEELRGMNIKPTYKADGIIKLNPLYKIKEEKTKLFVILSREFGFSPSSRRGIDLIQRGVEEKVDEFASFGQ